MSGEAQWQVTLETARLLKHFSGRNRAACQSYVRALSNRLLAVETGTKSIDRTINHRRYTLRVLTRSRVKVKL